MAQFLWNDQFIATSDTGRRHDVCAAGAFPRYSPVSGVAGATPQELGCCEQLDQDSFAIILAWLTGLTDSGHVRQDQGHRQPHRRAPVRGPRSAGRSSTATRRPRSRPRSPGWSRRARSLGPTATPPARPVGRRLPTRGGPAWLGRTYTTSGYWGGHQYYERLDTDDNPDDGDTICFQEGCYYAARRGRSRLPGPGAARRARRPADGRSPTSLAATVLGPTATPRCSSRCPTVTCTSTATCTTATERATPTAPGWPANAGNQHGRLWPVLSGERGEYEVASGRSAAVYLQSMADATNRRQLRTGAGLGPLGRLLFRAGRPDRQRRATDVGGGPVRAACAEHGGRKEHGNAVRRHLSLRHLIGPYYREGRQWRRHLTPLTASLCMPNSREGRLRDLRCD